MTKEYEDLLRDELIDFMNFISSTPSIELEAYSNEELVDGYLKSIKIKKKLTDTIISHVRNAYNLRC